MVKWLPQSLPQTYLLCVIRVSEIYFSSLQYSIINCSHHAWTLRPLTCTSYKTATLHRLTNISTFPLPPLSLYSFAFISWDYKGAKGPQDALNFSILCIKKYVRIFKCHYSSYTHRSNTYECPFIFSNIRSVPQMYSSLLIPK